MDSDRKYQSGDEPVPGFRLMAYVGRGSFGTVWRATAPGGTAVAIKILSLNMKGALKEFRALKLVKQIQHPNLVPILALWLKNAQGEILDEEAFDRVGDDSMRVPAATGTTILPRKPEPAELTIAMGLGHSSLAERLKECQDQGACGIPLDELLSYLHDAARALDYLNSGRHPLKADQKAIQHCDIKPSNILIVGDAAQVCDFGLAREVDDLRSTSLALSPLYAAPEIIETNVPSATTDQYSLAISYVELRTGKLPFPNDASAHTVIQSHLSGNLDWSSLMPAERQVIERATARRPADRFPSTTAMILALRDACYPRSKQSRGSGGTFTKTGRYKLGDEPVPGYRLVAFLGSGGFGEVWKATAPGGAQVAIKINKLGMKGALKEFQALKLVKSIHHPNVVPILALWLKNEQGEMLDEEAFDAVSVESSRDPTATIAVSPADYGMRVEPAELVVAMGLGEKSLTTRLEECRQQGQVGIPVAELLKYFHDAARAIDYMNRSRYEADGGSGSIQHCDIKPSNILIVGDAAQVCDFGLARQVHDARSTSLALSTAYAAPEMFETNVPSETTDQYSLAISYFELRTGELPFAQNSGAHTIVQAHLNGQLDFSRLPEAERKVLQRATSRHPQQRYPTAIEMVTALHEACFPRPSQVVSRTWGWWVAACLTVVILTAVVVSMRLQQPDPLQLPNEFKTVAAIGQEEQEVIVNDRLCPRRIIYALPGVADDQTITLRLVTPSPELGWRIPAFYIMEKPVSRKLFDVYLKQRSASDQASNNEAKNNESPVSDVASTGSTTGDPSGDAAVATSGVNAGHFACWLDGQLQSKDWSWNLPTAQQWDLAAGRGASNKAKGSTGTQPSDRASRGSPLPLWGRYSMRPLAIFARGQENDDAAASLITEIREWTCTPQASEDPEFVKCNPDGTLYLLIRSAKESESGRSECAEDQFEDLGFRLVVNVTELL